MTDPPPSGPPGGSAVNAVHRVSSTAAARALLRPAQRDVLSAFLDADRETAEVARELGLTVEQAAYRVTALVKLGLLTATGQRARGGRPVTSYRAAAVVEAPVGLLPEADTRALFNQLDAGGRDAFLDALTRGAERAGLRDWSVRLHRADGHVRLDLLPGDTRWSPDSATDDGLPAVLFQWVPLRLGADDAKQCQRDLTAVLASYAARSAPGPPGHLLGVFLTPL